VSADEVVVDITRFLPAAEAGVSELEDLAGLVRDLQARLEALEVHSDQVTRVVVAVNQRLQAARHQTVFVRTIQRSTWNYYGTTPQWSQLPLPFESGSDQMVQPIELIYNPAEFVQTKQTGMGSSHFAVAARKSDDRDAGREGPAPATPPNFHQDQVDAADSVMRRGVLAAGALIGAAMPIAYTNVGIGFACVLAGICAFAVSNYTAYRVGAKNYLMQPYASALTALVSAVLALVALTSVILP
jgi:hypothetical protein